MTISSFDTQHFDGGLTFSGSMCAPGVTSCGTTTPGGNHFGGALSSRFRIIGKSARNATQFRTMRATSRASPLARSRKETDNLDINGVAINRSIPQGVMGNWGVSNDHYTAAGITRRFARRGSDAIAPLNPI